MGIGGATLGRRAPRGQVFERTEELKVPDPNPPIHLTPQFNNTFTPLTGVKAVAAGWDENFCGQLGDGEVPRVGSVLVSGDNLSPPGAGKVPAPRSPCG